MAAILIKAKQRNKRIRDRVVDMYSQFVSEVDPKNVFNLLIEKRVISIHQKQEIANKVTVIDRCRALLDHLFCCSNDESFIVLREALEDQYHWIVERIDQCVTENETTHIWDPNCYRNKMTQTEQQEHLEEPLNVVLPSDLQEGAKKESHCGIGNINFEQKLEESKKENKNLAQGLHKSRKEIAEMKEQYRILKETLHKALDREKSLKKEMDAIKSRAKSDIFGNARETLDTTSKSSAPQQSHSTSSSESPRLFDSKVFVFGISDGASITQDIIEINLNRSDDASKAGQIPVEMISISAAAVHCDAIFVTGIGKKCDEIWRFDATSSNWKKCASLVQGRQNHSIAVVDHILFICGGLVNYDKKTLLEDVEAYETHEDQCVTVGKLAFAVYGFSNCVPFKSSLYIFGGLDANKKIVNKVQVYDTKLNTCIQLSKPMPGAQFLLQAVLWENTVILLGSNGCLTYNFETQLWEIIRHFKTNVYYFGLTISNGLAFVIGGGEYIKDADGKKKWICRDDVRSIPIVNILKNEPIDWRHHATLPKQSSVFAFGKMDFGLK